MQSRHSWTGFFSYFRRLCALGFHNLSHIWQPPTTLLCFTGAGNTKRIDKDGGSRRLDAAHRCLNQVLQLRLSKAKPGVRKCTYLIARHCSEQRDWGMRPVHWAGILLWSNISFPGCPRPVPLDLLLMQTALLASLLSIITKPEAKTGSIMHTSERQHHSTLLRCSSHCNWSWLCAHINVSGPLSLSCTLELICSRWGACSRSHKQTN